MERNSNSLPRQPLRRMLPRRARGKQIDPASRGQESPNIEPAASYAFARRRPTRGIISQKPRTSGGYGELIRPRGQTRWITTNFSRSRRGFPGRRECIISTLGCKHTYYILWSPALRPTTGSSCAGHTVTQSHLGRTFRRGACTALRRSPDRPVQALGRNRHAEPVVARDPRRITVSLRSLVPLQSRWAQPTLPLARRQRFDDLLLRLVLVAELTQLFARRR